MRSVHLWHLEMLQLVILRAAEERDACSQGRPPALLEGPPPSTLLFFALSPMHRHTLGSRHDGMTPFQHCPRYTSLPDNDNQGVAG